MNPELLLSCEEQFSNNIPESEYKAYGCEGDGSDHHRIVLGSHVSIEGVQEDEEASSDQHQPHLLEDRRTMLTTCRHLHQHDPQTNDATEEC